MVITESAARLLVADRGVLDLLQSVHSDKVAALAFDVVLQDVQRRADGSGFAAVGMHEDLRLSLDQKSGCA